MAEVDAIEVANGDDAASRRRGRIVLPIDEFGRDIVLRHTRICFRNFVMMQSELANG